MSNPAPIEAKKELRFLVECAIKGDNIDVVVGQIQALVDKAGVAELEALKRDFDTDRKTMDFSPATYDFIIDKRLSKLKAIMEIKEI